jgi:UDP-N-acetylmuramate dehydrogenase
MKTSNLTIQHQVDLFPYNTFGIHATAHAFAELNDLAQLKALKTAYDQFQQQVLILGGGSNVLFTKDFPGLVVLNRLKGMEIVREDDLQVQIKVASGEVWHDLVMYCIEQDWGGIENLSLIPGSVGAAPVQNIGAYGVELKDVLVSVEVMRWEDGAVGSISNEDCAFGYRDSIFKGEAKGQYLVLSITLQLTKHPDHFQLNYGAIQETLHEMGVVRPTLKAVSDAVIHIRKSKLPDPAVIGNAGSFFKNPVVSAEKARQMKEAFPKMPVYAQEDGFVKIPAGWLIEYCGWKGLRAGETGNHKDQALVIVNYGNASGAEVRDHAMKVQQSVRQTFDIRIEPEVNIL